MAAVATTTNDQTSLYEQLDAYPWAEDNEFQGGLSAILGSVQNPEQVEHLTLRAKCYYYARKAGTTVDFDGYRQWVEGHRNGVVNGSNSTSDAMPTENGGGAGGMAEAPKPASFAQIVELITEGKPIPGIKDIPDTILEGQSSESQAETRRKPWERSEAAGDMPSWMTA
ncbi:hypothetical protein AMS68_007570 [Peltaster fructicola]|uniref:Uncharacterized protein n=1 Tax=Peltaster fructicola TaxID=286661 RepID=A0A6H0Y4X4_9PEZI|nr:hypothetical protein AMS68_007570 [Peltaster fructicola]